VFAEARGIGQLGVAGPDFVRDSRRPQEVIDFRQCRAQDLVLIMVKGDWLVIIQHNPVCCEPINFAVHEN
jgi:hypothetical protein